MENEQPGNPNGSAEQPDSIRNDIAAAMDASEKAETTETGKPDVSEAARTLAAQRKAGGETTTTTTTTDAGSTEAKAKREAERAAMTPEARAAAEAADKAAEEVIEAPAHWPLADRDMFAKQAPEARKWLLNRHKAMEQDYTKKTQELAPVRKLKETVDEVFKPFRQQMQLDGIDEAQAIRQLVAAHDYLQRDPKAAIQWLAGNYKVDLKALTEGGAAADPAGESPLVKNLRTQLEELTKWKSEFTRERGTQEQEARVNEVTQFAEEKDDQGKLKRPYFNDVAKDVALLLRAGHAAGTPLTLQDAYDRALRTNPQTSERWLAERDSQRRAKEEAERKAKADAANKAGFDVKGQGAPTTVVAKTDDLRSDIEAAYSAAEGRV